MMVMMVRQGRDDDLHIVFEVEEKELTDNPGPLSWSFRFTSPPLKPDDVYLIESMMTELLQPDKLMVVQEFLQGPKPIARVFS